MFQGLDDIVAMRASGEQACGHITGYFKLRRSACFLLRDYPTRADFWASGQIANLDLDQIASSQLLSIPKSNKGVAAPATTTRW
jgi:hypothetical protein